jgi:hypothetical protein
LSAIRIAIATAALERWDESTGLATAETTTAGFAAEPDVTTTDDFCVDGAEGLAAENFRAVRV